MSSLPININLVFEDIPSEAVMIKILNSFGDKYNICTSYNGKGFGYIKNNINGFNEAAKSVCFFVLTDLDKKECLLDIRRGWLSRAEHHNLIFRVAVREVETWLLADREGFAHFAGVDIVNLPLQPEECIDPKKTLIDVIKKSRHRSLKEDIVPKNDKAKIGPDYNGKLLEYINNYWNINRASNNSESLRRAVDKIETFQFKQ